jgi:thiol:disulfide interchange protein
MRLERDEFVITYDPTKATPKTLLAAIREAGYTAQLVTGKGVQVAPVMPTVLPQGFVSLDKVVAQAKRERKPIVLDFTAEWCSPCQRMENTTFADAKVKALLERCIFVQVDADRQTRLSRRLGVVGLPDIRFVSPDGRIIHRLRGFQEAESFAAELDRFLQSLENK